MSSSLAKQEGPWQPLRNGMPVPSGAVGDAPLISVCFNETWLNAVRQALKLLVRPESWDGTLEQVRTAVSDAQEIIGNWQDGCGPQCSNWELALSLAQCPALSPDATLRPLDVCDPCSGSTAFWGFATEPTFPGSGFYALGLHGVILGTGTEVGGHFCQLRTQQIGGIIGNTFNLEILDCLGATTVYQFAGTSFVHNDFVAKRLCISALAPFALGISMDGNWLCGPA